MVSRGLTFNHGATWAAHGPAIPSRALHGDDARDVPAGSAWRVVQRIPVDLVDVDIAASLLLAAKQGIYAYDAYFLQCAVQLRCPLLTLDRTMMRVAKALKIQLVEMP